MKNDRGFITLEVIVIIFILGLFIKNIYPIIHKSMEINNEIINENEKVHIYKNIIESMKISKKNNENIELYNIDFVELFENFELHNPYSETLEILIEEEHYVMKIEKENKSEFWKIKLQVRSKRKDMEYEEFVEFLLQK